MNPSLIIILILIGSAISISGLNHKIIKKQLTNMSKGTYLDQYSDKISDTEFVGCPNDVIPTQIRIEDIICPKLSAPLFTENSATADLCLGCMLIF